MAFKPANANKTGGSSTKFERDPNLKYPEPKAGLRPVRVSLIVDLGIQDREDFEDPKTGEMKPQKPAHQVAVFADLTNDVVDYGGAVGKQQYRISLNKTFQGKMEGINFTAVPPRDADGNMIEGKKWGLHPANLLTKLAKATEHPDVIESMDIEVLLNEPVMVDVEVKKSESKDKKDEFGKPVVFTNVNFKGLSKVPNVEDDDGNEAPMKVKALNATPLCITFDNATAEQVQFIRGNLIAKIKTANNYVGSKMQKAIEDYEASKAAGEVKPADKEESFDDLPSAAPSKAKKVVAKPPVEVDDSESPF